MTNPKPKVNPAEIVASLRDVTVTYDLYQSRALSHVDVEFRRGEITGVLGAKGSGKSTAFKVLAGQLAPTEGKVKVFDRSPRTGAKGRVGYLPGKVDSNHPPGFVDRLLGRKKKSPTTGRGIARFAQAMLGNRDLLVLDDPFADLDPAELAEAKALIRDLANRGKTVVLSSDSLMDVKDLCGRLVILHDGKVQASGTLSELLLSPSAIRFFPAVLPADIVGRVLALLRAEILAGTKLPEAPGERGHNSAAEPQTPITRGAESSKPKLSQSEVDDTVDHQKLQGLVKPHNPK